MKVQAVKTKSDYPVIETDRLYLRMFDPGDLDAAYLLFNDPDVQKYLSPKNKRTREQLEILLKNAIRYWKEKGFGLWCITEKYVEDMVGYCGFQCFDKTDDVEIVFGLLKEHWGKGLATEAARACLRFGFENLQFKKVFAATNPQNFASLRVLEKSGMSFSAIENHYDMETVIYSITNHLIY